MLARNITIASTSTSTQGADRLRPSGLRWPFMRRLCKPHGIVSVPPSLLRTAPALRLGGSLRVGAAGALIPPAVGPIAHRLPHHWTPGWNCARFVRSCALSALRQPPAVLFPCGALSGPFSRATAALAVPGAAVAANSSSSCASAGLPTASNSAAGGIAALAPGCGALGGAEAVAVVQDEAGNQLGALPVADVGGGVEVLVGG